MDVVRILKDIRKLKLKMNLIEHDHQINLDHDTINSNDLDLDKDQNLAQISETKPQTAATKALLGPNQIEH